jgi:hypothetical protein
MWSARLDSGGSVTRGSKSGRRVACRETILVRCGSSSDDGGHLALSPAQRKVARSRAQMFLDNNPTIGYNLGLIYGAGSARRLSGPGTRATGSEVVSLSRQEQKHFTERRRVAKHAKEEKAIGRGEAWRLRVRWFISSRLRWQRVIPARAAAPGGEGQEGIDDAICQAF